MQVCNKHTQKNLSYSTDGPSEEILQRSCESMLLDIICSIGHLECPSTHSRVSLVLTMDYPLCWLGGSQLRVLTNEEVFLMGVLLEMKSLSFNSLFDGKGLLPLLRSRMMCLQGLFRLCEQEQGRGRLRNSKFTSILLTLRLEIHLFHSSPSRFVHSSLDDIHHHQSRRRRRCCESYPHMVS